MTRTKGQGRAGDEQRQDGKTWGNGDTGTARHGEMGSARHVDRGHRDGKTDTGKGDRATKG